MKPAEESAPRDFDAEPIEIPTVEELQEEDPGKRDYTPDDPDDPEAGHE